MISAWHLVWIAPLCAAVGVLLAALVCANDNDWRPRG